MKLNGYKLYPLPEDEQENPDRIYFVPEYRMNKDLGLDIRLVSYDKKKKTWALFIYASNRFKGIKEREDEPERTVMKVIETFKYSLREAEELIKIIPRFNADWIGDKLMEYVEGYTVVVILKNPEIEFGD